MAERQDDLEPWVLVGPVATLDGFAFDMMQWPFESREAAEDFRRNCAAADRSRYTAVLLKDTMYAATHYAPMKRRLNMVREIRDEANEFTGMAFADAADILSKRYDLKPSF